MARPGPKTDFTPQEKLQECKLHVTEIFTENGKINGKLHDVWKKISNNLNKKKITQRLQ